MNAILYDAPGVYVPQVCAKITLWRRDKTGDPFVGAELNSPHQAARFGDVYLVGDGEVKGYVAKTDGE